jgi:activator of HSP90 ATPase
MNDFKQYAQNNGNAPQSPNQHKDNSQQTTNQHNGNSQQTANQHNSNSQQKPKQKEESTESTTSSTNYSDFNNTANLVKLLGQAMNGKSQQEIFATILKEAEQGKQNGTLTNADLDTFYATVSPFLDGMKRKRLQQIISKLKAL